MPNLDKKITIKISLPALRHNLKIIKNTLPEDCLLTTSGGSVTLAFPEAASVNLELRTSAGRVSTELPVTVQGEQRRSSLIGKLGAGGPLIKAGTSGGNVKLERAHPRG